MPASHAHPEQRPILGPDPRPAASPHAATGSDCSWRAHPAREHPARAVLGLIVVAGLSALTAWVMGSPWWAALAAVIMLLALNRFYFPSRFTLDEDGITADYPLGSRRLRWRETRRFLHDRHGGWLSTRSKRTRLDGFGGLHVLFGREPGIIIGRIRARLAAGVPDAGEPRHAEAPAEGGPWAR